MGDNQMGENQMGENITFLIDETETENETDVEDHVIFDEFMNLQDDLTPYIVNYQLNFTLRQITQICDYYNIPKPKKVNKDILIQLVVHFENEPENEDIVSKRKILWFYMDELKNDKYMEKYIVLW